MEEENLMDFSTTDVEDSHYRATRRSSILRIPKSNQEAASMSKRRVSFASSSTIKPFATDSEKVTIWDTTYEEAMNNDSSKMSDDNSLEVDAMNTSTFFCSDNNVVLMQSKMEVNVKKLKLPKDKDEFLMDKENFNIHKHDLMLNTSCNQVQIYEDSTCNSDMSITMGSAQAAEIESNQIIPRTEEIEFSLNLQENAVPNKICNTQQINQSMELTSNLPVVDILCSKFGLDNMEPLFPLHMEHPKEPENKQQMEQSMQLTANIPVTDKFSTNINVAQTGKDMTQIESDDKKLPLGLPEIFEELRQTNVQQIDQSIELTANLPASNLIVTNTNIVQLETNITKIGLTDLDISVSLIENSQRSEKSNISQIDQSMQLTANLPVTNLFRTNSYITQTERSVLRVAFNDQALLASSHDNCRGSKQAVTAQQKNESMQLTANLPITNLFGTNFNITQTEKVASNEGSKQADNAQQKNESMQLTANLPITNLLGANSNITQTEKVAFNEGSKQAVNAQQKNESMQLTANLPITNLFGTNNNVTKTERGILRVSPKELLMSSSDNCESSRQTVNAQQKNESMQLTANLPVTNLFGTNSNITQTEKVVSNEGSKQAVIAQQTNESMQLTANLPLTNLLTTNTNITQKSKDTLGVGPNVLPDKDESSKQAINIQQMNQSTQLTAVIPVTNLFSANINYAHKEGDAMKLKSDVMEFTFGLSENVSPSKGTDNTKIFSESMKLTSDFPIVPAVKKSLSSTSNLFYEISGTVDATSDLLKSVDSSKKGITNLDEEGVTKSLQLMSLSRDASVDGVTNLRNSTRIFHGLYECMPSMTTFSNYLRNQQILKNVTDDQVQSTSYLEVVKNEELTGMNKGTSNLSMALTNEVQNSQNETVERLPYRFISLNKNEHIESVLKEVAMNNQIETQNENFLFSETELGETSTLQTFSNKENLSQVTYTQVTDAQPNITYQVFPFSQQTFVKTGTTENLSSVLTDKVPSTETETVERLPLNKNELLKSILNEVTMNQQIGKQKENFQISDAELDENRAPQFFSNKENLSEGILKRALTEKVTLNDQVVQQNQSLPLSRQSFVETRISQSLSNKENSSENIPEFTEPDLNIQQNEHVELVNVITQQSFLNNDASKDIVDNRTEHFDVKHRECFKQRASFNGIFEDVLDPDLIVHSLQGSLILTEFSSENVEIGVDKSLHTQFTAIRHNRVETMNPEMALLNAPKRVKTGLQHMRQLMDAKKMKIIQQELEANIAVMKKWEQFAAELDEREKIIKNIVKEKKYLQKSIPNKHVQEEFEKLMNANNIHDKDVEQCSSTTSETLEKEVSELFKRKKKNSWKFCGSSKDKQRYYFTALYDTVPFEAHIIPNTSTVCDVKVCQNLKATAPTLCKYNARILEYQFSNENLLVALGHDYDLLTLLDYVYGVIDDIIAFHQHFLDLRKNHGVLKLEIDPDFNVSFETVNINSLIWWVFTLKLSTTSIGHYDSLKIISQNYVKENVKEIECIAQGIPKGPLFLKNFIDNVMNYVNNYPDTYTIE